MEEEQQAEPCNVRGGAQWLSFLSNKLARPQMNESVDRSAADRLVWPTEFDAALTAINITMSSAARHELESNRLKGA